MIITEDCNLDGAQQEGRHRGEVPAGVGGGALGLGSSPASGHLRAGIYSMLMVLLFHVNSESETGFLKN